MISYLTFAYLQLKENAAFFSPLSLTFIDTTKFNSKVLLNATWVHPYKFRCIKCGHSNPMFTINFFFLFG